MSKNQGKMFIIPLILAGIRPSLAEIFLRQLFTILSHFFQNSFSRSPAAGAAQKVPGVIFPHLHKFKFKVLNSKII